MNELVDALRYCADGDNDCGDACPFYDKQPSCSMHDMMIDAADAIERLTAVRHGEWIRQGADCWRCSVCKELTDDYGRYCSNCGAKMKGDNDADN